jgi:hypothetical protein
MDMYEQMKNKFELLLQSIRFAMASGAHQCSLGEGEG